MNNDFPKNIEAHQLFEFFSDRTQMEWEEILQLFENLNPDDDGNEFYTCLIQDFLAFNFPKGNYAIIERARDFIDDIRNNKYDFMEEFNLDFSHLYGMEDDELHLLVVPFSNIGLVVDFGNKMKNFYNVYYWANGSFLGHNG